jgi:DNA helicase-4
MEWKRQTHSENGTVLIETYSYLNKDGMLLETFREKLLEKGVIFKEVDLIDIFNSIYDKENSNHFDEFVKFISSFLSLFKSNGFKFEMFDQMIKHLDICTFSIITQKSSWKLQSLYSCFIKNSLQREIKLISMI